MFRARPPRRMPRKAMATNSDSSSSMSPSRICSSWLYGNVQSTKNYNVSNAIYHSFPDSRSPFSYYPSLKLSLLNRLRRCQNFPCNSGQRKGNYLTKLFPINLHFVVYSFELTRFHFSNGECKFLTWRSCTEHTNTVRNDIISQNCICTRLKHTCNPTCYTKQLFSQNLRHILVSPSCYITVKICEL